MKVFMKALMAILALGLLTSAAFADTLSLTGPQIAGTGLGNGNGQQAAAISFNTVTGQSNLSMTVTLNGFSSSDTVSWWITNSLGSGTTGANVVDSGTFAGPAGSCCTPTVADFTVFSGENLAAGTYYVVLSTIGSNGNETGWIYTNSPAVTATGGLSYGNSFLTSQGPDGFAPGFAGYFSNSGVNLEFDITSDAGTPTPEPASLALLGSGLIGAGSFIRRKLIN
jgi:hypothetical protein